MFFFMIAFLSFKNLKIKFVFKSVPPPSFHYCFTEVCVRPIHTVYSWHWRAMHIYIQSYHYCCGRPQPICQNYLNVLFHKSFPFLILSSQTENKNTYVCSFVCADLCSTRSLLYCLFPCLWRREIISLTSGHLKWLSIKQTLTELNRGRKMELELAAPQ